MLEKKETPAKKTRDRRLHHKKWEMREKKGGGSGIHKKRPS